MSEKILVVDDQEENRALLCDFLTAKHYQVCEAEDGHIALQQALTHKPDLILMDIMMPNLNGYEACTKLKQDPATKDIPVIFLSSLTETKDKLKGFEAGGEDFFTKGGDLSELQARMQAHIKIRFLTKSLTEANQELQKKQKALNEDLTSAALIQRSLLPLTSHQKLPQLEIAWRCLPCQYIGGDIFNFIYLDEEHIAFYMLDVCGHGVPSAMVAVSVSQHFHELSTQAAAGSYSKLYNPLQLLEDLNHEYPMSRFERFFTISYVVLNINTGRLLHGLAGHPPAILLHKDAPYELLKAGGTVIGIDIIVPFEEDSKDLKPGDKIIFYTDGIFEYENPQGEFFSMSRFLDLLESIKHQPVDQIVLIVFDALNQFGQSEPIKDDISLMCVAYEG